MGDSVLVTLSDRPRFLGHLMRMECRAARQVQFWNSWMVGRGRFWTLHLQHLLLPLKVSCKRVIITPSVPAVLPIRPPCSHRITPDAVAFTVIQPAKFKDPSVSSHDRMVQWQIFLKIYHFAANKTPSLSHFHFEN